jgi:hypothetical protein
MSGNVNIPGLHSAVYAVRKEYESEGENEQRKKIVELTPRKYEGIGPTTKEGIPIVLRSVSFFAKLRSDIANILVGWKSRI